MILEIIIFLITTLIGFYIYSYKRIHNNFKEKDVRYLPGVPIFGNMYQSTFLNRHFIDDLEQVYRAYPEDRYVGLIEHTVPILMIRDPELIKTIAVKDFDYFTDHREFFTEESDPLFSGSLIFMKGEKWRNMRTTLSPAFTSSKMKFMLPYIIENTNHILEYIDENKDGDIDVDDLIRRYTNDVIASAGFGIQVNSLKDRDNDFFKFGTTIFDFNFRQKMLSILLVHFPELYKKFGVQILPVSTTNFFRNIVTTTMNYRKQEKIERADMIQLLMETPREWTPDEITGQVFLFFAAGFETSAAALCMTIHELALNTDVQEKLYTEVKNFKEEKELTFDNINELKYMDCVFNETLRKWSPAIILDRTCVKTYELPPAREGGKPVVLKPGDIIYNMVNSLQMDEKYFPDPEKYDPERFSEDNKHNIKPFTYMPFGTGPRICIGMRFAMMELKVLLYYIVLNYKIVKGKKTQDPIKLKPHNFKINAQGGSWVKFEKRE